MSLKESGFNLSELSIQTIPKKYYLNCEIFKSPVNNKWEVWDDSESHMYRGCFDSYKLAKGFIERMRGM